VADGAAGGGVVSAFLVTVWVVCGIGGGFACGWFIGARRWLLAAVCFGAAAIGVAARLAVAS
jgi:hypothetical protein